MVERLEQIERRIKIKRQLIEDMDAAKSRLMYAADLPAQKIMGGGGDVTRHIYFVWRAWIGQISILIRKTMEDTRTRCR